MPGRKVDTAFDVAAARFARDDGLMSEIYHLQCVIMH